MLILIDSNEKKPWLFEGERSEFRSMKKSGFDYSVLGYLKFIGVERKSYSDFLGRISTKKSLAKFKKNQLEKLIKVPYSCIIVEGHPGVKNRYGKIPPTVVLDKTIDIIQNYGIPIIFAGSRSLGERACLLWLKKAMAKVDKGEI